MENDGGIGFMKTYKVQNSFELIGITTLAFFFFSLCSQANTLAVWGDNRYGQMGLGDQSPSIVPKFVAGLSGIKQIAGGYQHTVALLENGTVMAWGNNKHGQLGLGNTTDRNKPTIIPGLSGVKQVAVGYTHTLALMNDGTIRAWGNNDCGQLGLGLSSDATVPMVVPGISGVKQITAGDAHTVVLLNNGTIKTWGLNMFGQLGLGINLNFIAVPMTVPGLSGVSQIAAGSEYTLALMNNGTVRAWGDNSTGQLGWGINVGAVNLPVFVPGLSGVKQIAAGNGHTLALMEDGTVKAWGYNAAGQLGLGDTKNRVTPTVVPSLSSVKQIAAGSAHSLALMENGTVKAWGYNGYGQLGLTYIISNQRVPLVVATVFNIQQIAAGYFFSLAVSN